MFFWNCFLKLVLIVNAVRGPPRPSRARSLCGSTASRRAGHVAIQEWTGSGVVGPIDVMGRSCAGIPEARAMHRARSESWSQDSVALRAGG